MINLPVREKSNNLGLTRSDTNRTVQSQRIVLDLESREINLLYYPCSENKGADQLRSYNNTNPCIN